MLKFIKKILLLISIFFLYLFFKEMLVLYQAVKSLHPAAQYVFLLLLAGVTIYFIIIPIGQILLLPHLERPTRDPDKIHGLIEKRMKRFRSNPYLLRSGFDSENLPGGREGYEAVLKKLSVQSEDIRRKYVIQVFYTTAIAQNGFLDGLIILSAGVNMVRDMFTLYHGRVSNRDILFIAKQVYYSILIGGSEGIEYATDEILSKIFSGSVKNLPFASKILGSIADGFVNAALLTRVALITENACTRIFIESDRALYPSYHTILTSTRILTGDMLRRIAGEVKKMGGDKTKKMILVTINPVGYLLGRVLQRRADESDSLSDESRLFLREASEIVNNPFSFVFQKITGIFQKSSPESLSI